MRVVERLERVDDVAALAAEWKALLRRLPDHSVFQTPEWILPWWRTFGAGRLHVIAERSVDGVESIAPLFVSREHDNRAPSLIFIGTGNSDRLDIIAADAGAAARVAREIEAGAAHLGLSLDLQRLPHSSPLVWACRAGTLSDGVPCPALDLPRDDASLELHVSQAMRKRLAYGRRRLAREGTLRFDTLRGSDVQDGLDELFQLHAARWQRKGGTGVLHDPDVRRFHRAVAASLDDAGELRLLRLRAGSETAAVYYGFLTGRRECFYIAGFNPRFSAASPGAVLLREVLRRAIDDGAEIFDFLSGREAYKYEWGAEDRPFVARTFWRPPESCLHHPTGEQRISGRYDGLSTSVDRAR